MRIAIVGAGIAGNVVARRLHAEHEITVFEAGDHAGGHTHTHAVQAGGRTWQVDTGFIVFNDWTYPNFIALLEELGVASQPSSMSFSVRCEDTDLEYNGTSLDSLFAQRRNLVRPAFWRMLRDIVRFNREAPRALAGVNQTLGDLLDAGGYSREFVDWYIVPMGAAIWSADPARLRAMPAPFFIRFFANHGMLSIDRRPQWRVVRGGSQRYVQALVAPFADRIRLQTPVVRVRRLATHVELHTRAGQVERFDHVFLACHSDQALGMLADPSPLERAVLGAIAYQANEVILHTDTALLPRRRRAWAAWNYHVPPAARGAVAVTYNMNILQGLDAPETFCVTLNPVHAIDPARVVRRLRYAHPVFTRAGVAAQARHGELCGGRTWYCGAYWRNGFHEDGVVSALEALRHFRERAGDAQLPVRRTA